MILSFRDFKGFEVDNAHCQVAGASPKGVGGRMADVLAAGSQKLLRDEDLSIPESTFGSCAGYVMKTPERERFHVCNKNQTP